MLMIALLMMAQTAPGPSPEALRLGRQLAESGALAGLLPVVTAKEREELVAEHAGWSDAEKAALRATADTVAAQGIERLMAATGKAYAEGLSIEDLRALVAFNATPAARRYRAAVPGVTMQGLAAAGENGGFDFKGEVRKAFCAKTRKGCPAD